MISKAYRAKRLANELSKAYDATLGVGRKELAKQYRMAAEEAKRQLGDMYDEIFASKMNDTLLMSDFYRYDRYYQLVEQLNKTLRSLGEKEVKITENKLVNMYIKSGIMVNDSIGFAGNIDYSIEAKNTIKQIWCADGELWSSRVWNNKAKMLDSIEKGLVDAVARGENKDKIVKGLVEEFDVGFNQADRIVRTELSWVQNKSAIDRYKEAGVEMYEILDSHGDDRECEDCKAINGKRFPINDTIHLPPFHPNCRCIALAIIE